MCVSELRTNIELTSVFLQSHRENHTRHTFNAKSNVSRAPLNCFFFAQYPLFLSLLLAFQLLFFRFKWKIFVIRNSKIKPMVKFPLTYVFGFGPSVQPYSCCFFVCFCNVCFNAQAVRSEDFKAQCLKNAHRSTKHPLFLSLSFTFSFLLQTAVIVLFSF